MIACRFTCVIYIRIWWNYRHQIQTYICPRRPFLVCSFNNILVCLFVCFLSTFACLASLLSVSLFLCYLFCLSVGFVFLVYLHVHVWSVNTTSKMQAKGEIPKRAMIIRLGGLTSSCGSLSLSLFLLVFSFKNMSIAF